MPGVLRSHDNSVGTPGEQLVIRIDVRHTELGGKVIAPRTGVRSRGAVRIRGQHLDVGQRAEQPRVRRGMRVGERRQRNLQSHSATPAGLKTLMSTTRPVAIDSRAASAR